MEPSTSIAVTVVAIPGILTVAACTVVLVVGAFAERSLRKQQRREDNERDQRSRAV